MTDVTEILMQLDKAREQPLTKMLLDAAKKWECKVSDLSICQQNCGDTIKFWIGRIPENIVDERSEVIRCQQAQLDIAKKALEVGLKAIEVYPGKEHPMTASEAIFKRALALLNNQEQDDENGN